MTLTETLQLEEKYLQFEDMRALEYSEKRYREAGEPTERWQMINFLERTIQELKRNGIGYPKVFLLRKKELQRQQFTIRPHGAANPDECSCIGGWLLAGKPCSCPKGESHRAQLRKWGMKI